MNARVYKGPMPPPNADPKLDGPRWLYTKWEQRFQPTERRWMLCYGCFVNAGRRWEW